MTTSPQNLVGQVFRCPICGAEVSVIRSADGKLAPRCCNQPMELLSTHHESFRCPVCGAEIMVIRRGRGALTPRCCNEPMVAREVAA
jgi:desulfoferrodoxin-like iron-binding protein